MRAVHLNVILASFFAISDKQLPMTVIVRNSIAVSSMSLGIISDLERLSGVFLRIKEPEEENFFRTRTSIQRIVWPNKTVLLL